MRSGMPQFGIHDNRSVKEIVCMLKEKKYDPVFTEWRRIPREDLLENEREIERVI